MGGLRQMWGQVTDALSLKSKFSVDVLWNVGSLVVLGAGGIVMNVVIASSRGPAVLGVFNQVFAFYIVLSQFAVGGMQLSALKYVSHRHSDIAECSRIASAALVVAGCLSGVVGIVAYLLSGPIGRFLNSPGVATGLVLVAPAMVFFALNKTLLMSLCGLRHMRAFAVFQSLRYVLLLAALCVLVLAGGPAGRLAGCFLIAESILFVCVVAYVCTRVFPLRLTGTRPWFGRHLSFGLRGFMSGVLGEMNTRVDVVMLGYFLPDTHVGVYSFAAIIAEGLAQLSHVVRQNMDPVLGRLFASGSAAAIPGAVRRVRSVFLPLVVVAGVLALAVYPLVLRVFVDAAAFAGSWQVLGILVLGMVVDAGYRPFRGILTQGGYPGTHTIVILFMVCSNIVLNAFLIPRLGILGAAAATSFVYVVAALLVIRSSRRLFSVEL